MSTSVVPAVEEVTAPVDGRPPGQTLERRGRKWLIWSFLLCPCHLPLSLAVLGAVLAGTSVGTLLSDHVWLAGSIISLTWLVGTGYGLRLIRQAERANGTCPIPKRQLRRQQRAAAARATADPLPK